MREIENFYNFNIKNFKNSYKKNGWGSKISQEKRFRVFCDIDNLNSSKILDLGCGTGDFNTYLKKKKIHVNYTGIDSNQNMINILKKKNIKCINQSIFNLKKFRNNSYDYIFLSGALNIPVINQNNKLFKLLKQMYRISKKGFAINFLSIYSDKINQKEFYMDPKDLVSICHKISKKFIIRHDYLPHDFTLLLYKK